MAAGPHAGTRNPLGAAMTIEELSGDPHAALARLRASEPVSWVSCLDGWLVTRHHDAVAVMSRPDRFTVDDPRFSTAQVIGPSMLNLDSEDHARHRAPFVAPFRPTAVAADLAEAVDVRAGHLIASLLGRHRMDIRRDFAGPFSAGVIARVLGLGDDDVDALLRQYDAIVASVNSITAGRGPTEEGVEGFAALRRRLEQVIVSERGGSLLARAVTHGAADSALRPEEIAANAAVLLFGGIETTEGMICNAALELLRRPERLAEVAASEEALNAAIEESLRLEPAAAIVDRYATADCSLGPAQISPGDLVRVSITAANRDPAVFSDPDTFDPSRRNLRRHLAFAQGPHVCLGVHLARLEARTALRALLELPGLRLDPGSPARVEGLVFRKPARVEVVWD